MTIPESPDKAIAKLLKWASTRNAVRAVLLTNTRAIPDASVDALSDYDVILGVDDIHPFVDDRT